MDVVENMRCKTARHKAQETEETSHLMKWIHRKGAVGAKDEERVGIVDHLLAHQPSFLPFAFLRDLCGFAANSRLS